MIEKFWGAIGPVALAAPGTAKGLVTVASTLGLRVKMIVALTDPSLQPIKLQVKRVLSSTQLEVGDPEKGIDDRTDVSAFGVTSFLYSPAQPRNNIPLQEIDRATYEEEPVVAWRVLQVDPFGKFYTVQNPLPVSLSSGSINIDTLNANLSVQIDHRPNFPNPGDVPDSVQVGDGVDILGINSDGSINVNIVQTDPNASQRLIKSYYNEAFSVPNGVLTTIHTYTVPVGKTGVLQRVGVNGENIAKYSVFMNGGLVDVRRTYFGAALNEDFDFTGYPEPGVALNTGDVIQVKVIHARPMAGDFGARIQILEVG